MNHLSNHLSLLLLLSCQVAFAQPVSQDVALSRAQLFLEHLSDKPSRCAPRQTACQLSLAHTATYRSVTTYYVFNISDEQGFVIVGGDKSAYEILGFCDHGSFSYDLAPDNFKGWLDQYAIQIALAASRTKPAITDHNDQTSSRSSIPPLVKAKWSQIEPYNQLIPKYNDSTFVTGCVATAMSQVMRHHRWPITGTGEHSYMLAAYPELTFSANFSQTTYKWDDMLNTYVTGQYDATQAEAVATLMYHTGVSTDMKYGTESSGSGTPSDKIGYALATYFGYDRSVRIEYRSYYTDDEWEQLIYDELARQRPVFYSGKALSGAGHQFVCDGYDSELEMFAFNWGWNGKCDGYYRLTGAGAIQPNDRGISEIDNTEDDAYDQNQKIILNVMPAGRNQESAHLGQIENNNGVMYLKADGNTYEENYIYDPSMGPHNVRLYTTLKNLSCITTEFDYGVKAVETTTGATHLIPSHSGESLSRNHHYKNAIPLSFDPSTWADGTYQLRPICRAAGQDDTEWNEVDIMIDETYPTITIITPPVTSIHVFNREDEYASPQIILSSDGIVHDKMQSGFNIIRYPDGTVRKTYILK